MPDVERSRADDLNLLTAAAAEAATLALGYFKQDPRVWAKANDSPVSEADMAVDLFLREHLTGERPGYGWLSEETEDAAERLGRRRVFVVDPIDGTRGFLAGSDEWAISLAVVEDGRPVVAALMQPVTGAMFTAILGEGARRDGSSIELRPEPPMAFARVAGPSSLYNHLKRGPGIASTAYIASLALRIAMVADGRLDLALAKANARDWDIAAADLILSEAGGALVGPGGRAPAYNRAETNHPILAAARPALAREAIDLVAPEPAHS